MRASTVAPANGQVLKERASVLRWSGVVISHLSVKIANGLLLPSVPLLYILDVRGEPAAGYAAVVLLLLVLIVIISTIGESSPEAWDSVIRRIS